MHIIDARPYKNAVGNQVMGAGFETAENYNDAEVVFMSIENIHVVRESLKRMCHRTTTAAEWLGHISSILTAAVRVVAIVDGAGGSCLVHCSDGWDRTPQISALASLMMDPYYRTIDGFIVLVCKEWLSFGHKFSQRLGHGVRRPDDEQRSPIFVQFRKLVSEHGWGRVGGGCGRGRVWGVWV